VKIRKKAKRNIKKNNIGFNINVFLPNFNRMGKMEDIKLSGCNVLRWTYPS